MSERKYTYQQMETWMNSKKVMDLIANTQSEKVFLDVQAERKRQDKIWGIRRHDMGTWLKILVEEVGEVAQAMQKDMYCAKETDVNDLYKELIQVAAVAVAIAEQVKESGLS